MSHAIPKQEKENKLNKKKKRTFCGLTRACLCPASKESLLWLIAWEYNWESSLAEFLNAEYKTLSLSSTIAALLSTFLFLAITFVFLLFFLSNFFLWLFTINNLILFFYVSSSCSGPQNPHFGLLFGPKNYTAHSHRGINNWRWDSLVFPKFGTLRERLMEWIKTNSFIAFNANLQVFEEFSLACYIIWIGELIGC